MRIPGFQGSGIQVTGTASALPDACDGKLQLERQILLPEDPGHINSASQELYLPTNLPFEVDPS